MSGIRIMTSAIVAFAVASVSSASIATDEVDATLRANLGNISHKRIFFGHQSVGENLLEGIKHLSTKTGIPVRIAEVASADEVKPATFGHAYVAENGNPLLKLKNFEHAFGRQHSSVDIAMVKFCFVDINANTDVNALFGNYRQTIESLRTKNPGITFVHITAPLTSVKSGLKSYLKKLLGRGDSVVNERREEYNNLIRNAYRGREPIFDLAHVESTAPDGKAVTVDGKNGAVPVMDVVYTDDGGHLNETGQLHAARELISVLAAIPDHSVKRNSVQ